MLDLLPSLKASFITLKYMLQREREREREGGEQDGEIRFSAMIKRVEVNPVLM